MDKIAIGKMIKAERQKRGITQWQLGKLCGGLTDKAVSKWENGKAVPDRTVCQKLSSLLGFDFDLLINDNLSPDQAEQLINNQKIALWEKAEARMKELYGKEPPLQIENRFLLEKNTLRYNSCVILFDVLAKVKDAARKRPARFEAPGCECFVSWLLGATEVNPLEPHLRCPKCKRVEFHPEVQSGWDLEETVCECGTRMEADGQDIPVETCLIGGVKMYEHFSCPVDPEFMKEAERIILTYGEQYFGMEVYREEEEEGFVTEPDTGAYVIDQETNKKIPYHYMPVSVLLFRPKKQDKIKRPESIGGPSEMLNWGREAGCPAICLMGGFTDPPYTALPSPFRSTPDKLVKQEIMEQALKDYWAYWDPVLQERTELKFPDLTPYIGELTFGKFVTLICSVNNLYMCGGPEALAQKTGFGDLTDMPLSMEDLWKLICSCTPYPGYMSGTVIELMIKVKNGEYLGGREYLPGPSAHDRKLFRELNLPKWFETYASDIFCLCYRTPYIEMAIRLLEDARKRIRERR